MTTLVTALAVAFAAFCVWLTVRLVNRRERWAKWTAGSLVTGAASIATFLTVGESLAEHGDLTIPILCALLAAVVAAIVTAVFVVWLFSKFPAG